MKHSAMNKGVMLDWILHCAETGAAMPNDEAIMDRFNFASPDMARTLLADLADAGKIRLRGAGADRVIELGGRVPSPAPRAIAAPPVRSEAARQPAAPTRRAEIARLAEKLQQPKMPAVPPTADAISEIPREASGTARKAPSGSSSGDPSRASGSASIARVVPPPAPKAEAAPSRGLAGPPEVKPVPHVAAAPEAQSPPAASTDRPPHRSRPGKMRTVGAPCRGVLLDHIEDRAHAEKRPLGVIALELMEQAIAAGPIPALRLMGKLRVPAMIVAASGRAGKPLDTYLAELIDVGFQQMQRGEA